MDLNHTIVPAHDKEESARFFARMFGLRYEGPAGHFAPVKVNDSLTMDFDNSERFESHHYALKVGDDEFDAVLGRVQTEGVVYGSSPFSRKDMKLNDWNGGRGLYFDDPNGHVLEILTREG